MEKEVTVIRVESSVSQDDESRDTEDAESRDNDNDEEEEGEDVTHGDKKEEMREETTTEAFDTNDAVTTSAAEATTIKYDFNHH